MLTKKRYSIKEMASWTRWESSGFILYALLIAILYSLFDYTFIQVPWTPVALIGTAVAFMVGFQNNAAYGRIWEARKIWGGIVNTSRTWTVKIHAMINNTNASDPLSDEELYAIKLKLVHRHVAWLTALRHAMRQKKSWEVFEEHSTNKEWSNLIYNPEKITRLTDDLAPYLSIEEKEYVMSKGNKTNAILFLQSKNLQLLEDQGYLWKFSHLNLEDVIQELFTLQGKSERIKNFPYPRQYATLSYFFVYVFLLMIPFGIVPEFHKIGMNLNNHFPIISTYFVWLAVPFCGAVSWVFHTMERIGRVGENPFEGSANDVPISTISRGIEIDLRQLMDEDEKDIPTQFPEQSNVQM